MFRHPESSGASPRLSKVQAKALRRKDRFPKLPLMITLRETAFAMRSHWQELCALGWLVLLVFAIGKICTRVLQEVFIPTAAAQTPLDVVRLEVLQFISASLFEFLMLGFFSLAVYRLMLLGEPPSTPRYTDAWLRRFLAFMAATLQAMLLPLLAFVPYLALFIWRLVWMGVAGDTPSGWQASVHQLPWVLPAVKGLCTLAFYLFFARYAFVQAATAVDVPYSPREAWRVTSWVWRHMLTILLVTLGLATILIAALGVGFAAVGASGWAAFALYTVVAASLWMLGLTGYVVALSIAFCLRTGWRPGAQKLSLLARPRASKALID